VQGQKTGGKKEIKSIYIPAFIGIPTYNSTNANPLIVSHEFALK
jgi:hypothetical protein